MLCDIVVLYFVKRKTYYRSKKYQVVNDPDDDDEVNKKISLINLPYAPTLCLEVLPIQVCAAYYQ